ncbi:hypothetical protein TRFO_24416 [Tritrichomonas foetus]|uniref:Initiator binding domain-containing protein n=1 Tax=Tritrichomonas foetus TaxID=1144522 RepID=A0A1J4K937_9EUKA|nr:hypothetical protein TRFO_24416 [Tritrichomonas foetus]|eukprot:OHT07400.1 hypothetical protein TRFO_24416 [Tritrichomonas foetus]
MPRQSIFTITETPQYWDFLSAEDQNKYHHLKKQFTHPKYKNRRNKSNDVFKDIIKNIKRFVMRNDENDVIRSLVCGIIWIDDVIVINTHQLRILIDKCKSSINGSFQAIGYEAIPPASDSACELVSMYPFMKNNYGELRQWTSRQLIRESKNPQISNVNDKNSSTTEGNVEGNSNNSINGTNTDNVTKIILNDGEIIPPQRNDQNINVIQDNSKKTLKSNGNNEISIVRQESSIPRKHDNGRETILLATLIDSHEETIITSPPFIDDFINTGFSTRENEDYKFINTLNMDDLVSISSLNVDKDPLSLFPRHELNIPSYFSEFRGDILFIDDIFWKE